jgi:hypothetical protein
MGQKLPLGIQLKDEKYYQTAVCLVFRMLGLFCLSEVQTTGGRIDCLVEIGRYLYCFEFKLNETAEAALAQIGRKDYLLPWQGSDKAPVKAGVSFDHGKRNIGECQVAR